MFAFKSYSEEASTSFMFKVLFTDPVGDQHIMFVYSYIEDPAVIALLTKGIVKYDFTIERWYSETPVAMTHSLNQYVGKLRRMYAYKKETVTRKKVVTYQETITVEL